MIDINSVWCGDIVSLCKYSGTRGLYWDVVVEVIGISDDRKRITAKIPKPVWVETYGKDCLLTHPNNITTFTESLAPGKFAPEIISRFELNQELDSFLDEL